MGLKINDVLINKNEILAIIPREIKTKKTTKYEIVIHFSKAYIATYDNETQWKTAYQSLLEGVRK